MRGMTQNKYKIGSVDLPVPSDPDEFLRKYDVQILKKLIDRQVEELF